MAAKRRRAKPKPELSPGFAARVADKEVNLIKLIDEGIPPLEFIPGSSGMLVRGTRHTIIGRRKSGKSIATLVQVVSLIQRGGTVIILDRENGERTYASRLEEILADWGEAPDLRDRINKHLHYIPFPTLKFGDGEELAAWSQGMDADLVVFDSQRMFLTDLGLSEELADDYAQFAGEMIDPLFQAGIATLVLGNPGHSETSRARGSSAQQDLPEVLFEFKADPAFSIEQKGRAKLTLKPGESRLGTQGEWTMAIGGGTFGEWKERPASDGGSVPVISKGRTEAQKLILKRVKKAPCSRRKAIDDSVGHGVGKKGLEEAVRDLLASDDLVRDDKGVLHASK